MKRKIQKITIAFAMFISLPFTTYSRECGCKEMGQLTGSGFEWNVPDNVGCCSQAGIDNASDVYRLTRIRNSDGSITTARTRDSIGNAARGCC